MNCFVKKLTSELWYISSHGFGYITRAVANIERKLKSDRNYKVIIISGENQIQFAQQYFSTDTSRVIFHVADTDVGLINKPSSLEVDKELLEAKLFTFMDS